MKIQEGKKEESSALYDHEIKEKDEGVRLFPASSPLRGKKLLLDIINL